MESRQAAPEHQQGLMVTEGSVTMSEAIEALAEAWASLDGKLDEFLAGRRGEDTEGDYHGYLSDAAELAKRLEHRGYVIVRAPRDT